MRRPGLIKKAGTLVKAVVLHAADGFHRADDDVMATRQAACDECPANRGGECQLCGCLISLKVTWRSERCPMEMW
jgi:hypothetical protein